ncbi:hypothetical protein [Bradyrhizobium sp. SZCCHNS3053]|uniref:hypothetical protein n=1 Tax=Bradyrhizobium sp. SZCCHNS3053 TaxID=3057322 RepID=UPI002916EB0B|nr:hypothetical protein [Bradyrhizobium sp. SZCCHNS3053]
MIFELMMRFKRRNMCPVKRRAIELLERDDVAAVQMAESRGAGNNTYYEIRAMQGRSFRARTLA